VATPAAPTREPRILVEDLPAEHLDELDFLMERRAAMVRSYIHFASHLADLDRRLEANAIGLEVASRPALPLLEEALGEKETSRTTAAAWALLRIGGERSEKALLGALEAGPPPAREGARQALVFGPKAPVLDRVKALAESPDPAPAVAAAEVLAAHGAGAAPRALPAWLANPDPEVRLAACRIAAWTGGGAEKLEGIAREDADASVRLAAFEAGAWLRAPWVLALGRERARAKADGHPGVLKLFCALAERADAPLVAALGAATALGPARWAMLAAYGSGPSIEACLAGISAKDAADAEAAGAAFARLCGIEMGAAQRVPLPAPADAGPEADDFTQEFADEAFVPDPAVARAHWEARKQDYGKGTRWCRGRESDAAGPAVLAELDLGSRYETLMRARFRGAWSGSRRELLLLR
jgi:hypothetical protein